MDNLARAIVIAAIVVGAAILLRGLYPADRYALVTTNGGAYRIDRVSGAVAFCDALLCRTLPVAAFAPGSKPAQPAKPPETGT